VTSSRTCFNESRFGTVCGPTYDSAEGYTRLGFGNQNKAPVSRIESGVIHNSGVIVLVMKLHVLS